MVLQVLRRSIMSKSEYKKYVKSKKKDAAVEHLKQLQEKLTKIHHIKYDDLKTPRIYAESSFQKLGS